MDDETRACVFSRECGTGVLARLPGSTYFPERPVGAAIVSTLRRPRGRVVCVTAPPLVEADAQLAYFASLADSTSLDRVSLVGVDDDSARWLSTKLLDDGVACRRLAEAGPTALAYFEPSANLERLADDLGVSRDQPCSGVIPLGTKAAGRALFREAGVPIAAGTPECRDLGTLARELATLTAAGHRRFVLKLSNTEYGAGLGNARIDLPPGGDERRIAALLPTSHVVDELLGWDGFAGEIATAGVLAEEWLDGAEIRSPSFQGRIADGVAHAVSTHEQVLADNRQTFAGCAFPAADDYRAELIRHGLAVGRLLVERGVDRGDYGVDLIALRATAASPWRLYGCELNLRATGTKHGFDMATALLGVVPDDDGVLRLPNGEPRVYVSTDAVLAPPELTVRELVARVEASPVHFDRRRLCGVALHMLSTLPTYGRFGAVAIAATRVEADELLSALRTLVR
ncbi:MAG TPA: peptide ligase PGM1-related protein [Pseudonocardiaceae bacterium]